MINILQYRICINADAYSENEYDVLLFIAKKKFYVAYNVQKFWWTHISAKFSQQWKKITMGNEYKNF